MPPDRRKQLVLAVLLVALVGVLYLRWPIGPQAAPAAAGARGRAPAAARSESPIAPEVHLEALNAIHPPPAATERNLFRFRTRPVDRSEPRELPPPPPVVPPSGPPAPPPPPPIPLKFIGILESDHTPRTAILSDGRGPIYGKAGDAVLGQYRILHIGAESIEIAYLDGRGRQTIRLSGS